jgi:hypothetical protein
MSFICEYNIKFKFSYGFFIDSNEIGIYPLGNSGYDIKYKLLDHLVRTYNLPENFIDVCLNDFDNTNDKNFDKIFICLEGSELLSEEIGEFEEVSNDVLNPPTESKDKIHELSRIAGNKKCGFYMFAYNC